jgi:phosphoribosyl 1,2-cyclic phosphodiesterase
MRIRFWGVRGSLPTPLTPSRVRSKISAVLERVTAADLESPASKERFLAALPPWLFGTVGGNSPCLEVRTDEGIPLIFDCGTGVREFGAAAVKEKTPPSEYHVFFSHLHWDHIQGLPFFNPAYDPSKQVYFYYPEAGLADRLQDQMKAPYFPVPMAVMGSRKKFVHATEPIRIGGADVSWRPMQHPGGSFAYRVAEGDKRFIYATDTELSADDFQRGEENSAFFGGADVLVIDSQYTLGEAIEKYSWGHTAFSLAADFAANWGIGQLVLFHHDPTYDDRKLHGILQSARWYIDHMAIKGVEVRLASEGLEIGL